MISLNPEHAGSNRSELYQLKVTLEESEPAIWRRVVVRGDMRLDRLHKVIQIVMGWTDSHLHQFIVGPRSDPTYFGQPDPDVPSGVSRTLNERRYVLAELAPVVKKKISYEYDFGDGWEHEVLMEKILPPDPGFKHPICLAGENNRPPEDCGGIYGYYDMLEALAHPSHPNHNDMLEWIGEWDPTAFDLGETNRILKRLKA